MFSDAGFLVGGEYVPESTKLLVARKGGVWLAVTLEDFDFETVKRAIEELRDTYERHDANAKEQMVQVKVTL